MLSAFILGIAGSLHCVFMCGPLMLILRSNKKLSLLKYHLIYHSGRISMYALLGVFAGLIGEGFSLAGGHQILAILLGGLIILVGVSNLIQLYYWKIKVPLLDKLTSWLIKKNTQIKTSSTFIKGMLNGLLPCGLVYVALAGAIVSNDFFEGLTYMVFFGIGTTPILLFIVLFGPINQRLKRLPLQKILPWITIIFGIWILIRGLGIGIPFWSPNAERLNITNEMPQHH